jgi:hypothetical protein
MPCGFADSTGQHTGQQAYWQLSTVYSLLMHMLVRMGSNTLVCTSLRLPYLEEWLGWLGGNRGTCMADLVTNVPPLTAYTLLPPSLRIYILRRDLRAA